MGWRILLAANIISYGYGDLIYIYFDSLSKCYFSRYANDVIFLSYVWKNSRLIFETLRKDCPCQTFRSARILLKWNLQIRCIYTQHNRFKVERWHIFYAKIELLSQIISHNVVFLAWLLWGGLTNVIHLENLEKPEERWGQFLPSQRLDKRNWLNIFPRNV